jgi:hypothetical protein
MIPFVFFFETLINLICLYNSCQGSRWGVGKLSIPKVIGINHWIVILMTWVVLILVLGMIEKKSSKNYNPPIPLSKRERGIIKSDNPQDSEPFQPTRVAR